jgi:hypothetical protein
MKQRKRGVKVEFRDRLYSRSAWNRWLCGHIKLMIRRDRQLARHT